MAKRKIVLEGDEVLRKKCRPVDQFDQKLWELLEDMSDTLYGSGNGVGLAAPQVGILRRVVVIDVGEGLIELCNPEIIAQSGKQTGNEGCLSSPGEYGIVTRPRKVKVRALDRHGKPFEIAGEDLLARAFCHEIDHLEGRLFKDIAERMLDEDEK
ncbi:MAG: peptide deformylase [Provencibacterium sp.]|jgi:peptide deformylase|nr:peptide deformylase [Provencibacterium sp.]